MNALLATHKGFNKSNALGKLLKQLGCMRSLYVSQQIACCYSEILPIDREEPFEF